MKSFGGELAKQRDRFRSHHRVESVQRFVENQNCGFVRDRLGEPYALPHSLAVTRNFSIGGLNEIYVFERNLAQLVRTLSIETMDQQKRVDKLASRHASRERIELHAVADFAKQLLGLVSRNTQDFDRAARLFRKVGY